MAHPWLLGVDQAYKHAMTGQPGCPDFHLNISWFQFCTEDKH
jgi:hypothetical protein